MENCNFEWVFGEFFDGGNIFTLIWEIAAESLVGFALLEGGNARRLN